MITCIISDFHTFPIAALFGIEKELLQKLTVPKDRILPALDRRCCKSSLLEAVVKRPKQATG